MGNWHTYLALLPLLINYFINNFVISYIISVPILEANVSFLWGENDFYPLNYHNILW